MPQLYVRCPTLMVTSAGSLERILIPDGSHGRSDEDAFDSALKPHYAGMMVVAHDGRRIKLQMEFHGHHVAVGSGVRRPCAADATLAQIPDLVRLIHAPSSSLALRLRNTHELDNRLAAEIVFNGGFFGAVPPLSGSHTFSFPTAFGSEPQASRISSFGYWTPDDGVLTIEITAPDGTRIVLNPDADDFVFIYNWDIRWPTVGELFKTNPIECKTGEVHPDHDFEWMYQLLMAPRDDWRDWLGKTDLGRLPAPEIRCDVQPAPADEEPGDAFHLDGVPAWLEEWLRSSSTGQCGCARWSA